MKKNTKKRDKKISGKNIKPKKEKLNVKKKAKSRLSVKSSRPKRQGLLSIYKLKLCTKRLIERSFTKKSAIKITILATILTSVFLWLFWGIPLPAKIGSNLVPVSTKLFDRNEKLIFEIYTDKRSTPVEISELPEHVIDATLSIEDKDFYKHHGISLTGVMRAAYKTIFRQKLEGGSTLTQQLVKNMLLSPERTVKRKIRELVLTLIVEVIYSKDKILSLYLNQIPYGSTAYGIGAASELYFAKEAKNLSLSEAALLAGLPAAPTKYSPFGVRPELAKNRQETVLRRMVEDGHITQEEADQTFAEKLKFAEPEKLKAPHFSLWVKELLAEEYGDAIVEQGGLRVTTTLDLNLQEFAEKAVAEEVAKLKKLNVGNGAALVTRPASGEILAMVGSKDYFASDEDGKVNIIFSHRQPGSSIKPLNYALALQDKKITLATPLADVPTCFSVISQKAYCPRNYDGAFHGAVQARFALGNSYNIPAVRVLALNGIENFFNFAKQMGITNWTNPDNYGLSLTLGGGEVAPYEIATAFGTFANQGIKQNLISILKVTDYKGKVLSEVDIDKIELSGDRVIEPEVAFLISHTLHDGNARTQAFGTRSYLNVSGHPEVSVKTGTTNNLRDNWTIGYTAHTLVAAWVGNNDNSEMSGAVSGVSGASPIWNKIMKEVLDKAEEGYYNEGDEGHAWPRKPQNIVGANICATTGNLPSNPDNPDCATRFEYFLKDNVGAGINSGATDVQIDKTKGYLAQSESPEDLKETQNRPYLLDPLGTMVCLDCAIPEWPVTIHYSPQHY